MIAEALHEYAKTLERAFEHDRSNTVGASEIGKCARQVYYQKNLGDPVYGAPIDPWYEDDWGYRLRGKIVEDHFWYPAMKAKYGDALKFAGPDQKTMADGMLSATPDGLLLLNDRQEAQDAKSIDPRVSMLPKPEHVYQVKVQIEMFHAVTPYRPDGGRLSYIDASRWSIVKEFEVQRDPDLYAHAKERAQQIILARSAAELKPEGWIAGGRECEFCPFTKACGIARTNVPDEDRPINPVIAKQVETKAWLHQALAGQEKEAARKRREIAEQIKQLLRDARVSKIPGIVTWSAVKATARYDFKAIAASGIDLSAFRCDGEPDDRLMITLKSGEAPT
jgi:hypothetical protein